MFDQSIDQNILPSVLGTARCVLLPSALNNCILYYCTFSKSCLKMFHSFWYINIAIEGCIIPAYFWRLQLLKNRRIVIIAHLPWHGNFFLVLFEGLYRFYFVLRQARVPLADFYAIPTGTKWKAKKRCNMNFIIYILST